MLNSHPRTNWVSGTSIFSIGRLFKFYLVSLLNHLSKPTYRFQVLLRARDLMFKAFRGLLFGLTEKAALMATEEKSKATSPDAKTHYLLPFTHSFLSSTTTLGKANTSLE